MSAADLEAELRANEAQLAMAREQARLNGETALRLEGIVLYLRSALAKAKTSAVDFGGFFDSVAAAATRLEGYGVTEAAPRGEA